MEEMLAKVSDYRTLWILILGQAALIIQGWAKRLIESRARKADAVFDDARAQKKTDSATLDTVMAKLVELEPMVRGTKAELDLYREYIMAIPKLRDDLGIAFRWLKTGSNNLPPDAQPK